MKKMLLFLPVVLWLMLISGCEESVKKVKSDNVINHTRVPETMIGVWEAVADTHGATWAFKIEPDGSIPKLIHPVAGEVNVKLGGYDIEGPDPGTYAAFIMGPCETFYDDSNDIFTVHIVLDAFTMKFPQGELTGKSDDYFRGKVSEDGNVWNAEWVSYSSLEGGSLPDVNEINANPVKLVFIKIDPNNLAEPNGVK